MRTIAMILGIASFSMAAFAAGNSKPVTISVDNTPALKLQLPAGWTSTSHSRSTDLVSPKFDVHMQLWNVQDAKTAVDAIALVPAIIKDEVIEFKTVATKDIQVAGSVGKHIIATGTEADDNDPSNVEVFIFSVAGKVFLLCAHGEGDGASKARASILRILATVNKP
jgi:hypothetical protein